MYWSYLIHLALCIQLLTGVWTRDNNEAGNAVVDDSLPQHVHLGRLIQRINKTNDDLVDKSIEDLMHVYHSGNLCPFHRKVVAKMLRNEKVKIMILGGSVTYGADLPDRLHQRWSQKFTEILEESHAYKGGFDIANLGVGACNVNVWVWRAREFASADLVIVDLSVNDQGFELSELPIWYENLIQVLDALPNPPALLFHQAFRSAQQKEVEIQKSCPAKNEHITCCGGGTFFCKRWYDMHDFVVEALQKYQVPYVSYRDLVWPNYTQPTDNLNVFWNGLSHPDYKAHALMAKLIATGLMMEVKESHKRREFCKAHPEMDHYAHGKLKDKKAATLCMQTKSHMLASDSIQSRVTFTLHKQHDAMQEMSINHWTFTNDTANKFGWILTSGKEELQAVCQSNNFCDAMIPAHTLSLDIEVGEKNPIIQIFYLTSHSENMGKALVWVDDKKEEHAVLDSLLDMPYSVTKVVTIAKEDLGGLGATKRGDSIIFPSLTPGKHVLHFSVQSFAKDKGYKWKLIGVSTC